MFQFNFNVGVDKADEDAAVSKSSSSNQKWLQAQSHAVTSKHLDSLMGDSIVDEIMIGETTVKYLSMTTALERLKKEQTANILPVLNDNTDLVPAVYEGGLKIWECTWDLLQHLASCEIEFKGLRVLELGCGAGLPAVYALIQGAHVTLQDYNEEVINYITIPNMLLNAVDFSALEEENSYDSAVNDISARTHFYSGDWGELESLFSKSKGSCEANSISNEKTENKPENPLVIDDDSNKFDLILTSETIYNAECHQKLLSLMTKSLKRNGKILLAAKSYYFGVGGGIHQFCELVKNQKHLDFKTVLTNEIGYMNIFT